MTDARGLIMRPFVPPAAPQLGTGPQLKPEQLSAPPVATPEQPSITGPGFPTPPSQPQPGGKTQRSFDIEYDNADGSLTGPLDKRVFTVKASDHTEAQGLLQHYLDMTHQMRDPGQRSSDDARAWQSVIEHAAPPVGATIGGAMGGVPGAAIGGALGDVTSQITQPFLNAPAAAERSLTSRITEPLVHGAEGGIAQATGEAYVNPAIAAAKNAAMRRVVMGPGSVPDITPGEAAMYQPGAPLQEGATLTGKEAFPPAPAYGTGLFSSLYKYISGAIGVRGPLIKQMRQGATNLNAYGTNIVRELSANPDPGAVGAAIPQLLDTTEAGRAAVQKQLYKPIDDAITQFSPGQGHVDTTGLLTLMERPGIGPTVDNVEQGILSRLAARPAAPIQATKEYTRTTTSPTPDTSAYRNTAETTQASPRGSTAKTAEDTGVRTTTSDVTPQGQVVPTTTAEGTQTASTQQNKLRLGGLLHTLEDDGSFSNAIPLGEAREISSKLGELIRDEAKAGNMKSPEFNVAAAMKKSLDGSIDQTLDALPNLPNGRTWQAQYRIADNYTRESHELLGNDVITKLALSLDPEKGGNPALFYDYFVKPGGVDVINRLRDALAAHPSTAHYFEQVVQPNLTAGLLRDAVNPTTIQNFAPAVQGSKPLQQLITDGELLQFQPGQMHTAMKNLGDTTFEALAGGKAQAQRLLQLDDSLLAWQQKQGSYGESVAMLIAQSGGASSFLTGTSHVAQATSVPQIMHGLTGMAAGGILMFTPTSINKLINNPAQFRRLIQGLDLPVNHPNLVNFLTQTATQNGLDFAREKVKQAFTPSPTPTEVPSLPGALTSGQSYQPQAATLPPPAPTAPPPAHRPPFIQFQWR